MAEKIEKLPLTSMDLKENQLLKLKELFPEVFTEGMKVNWEKLKLTLGEDIDTGKERFGMNWAGKADCYKTIQQPSIATLIPVREESINFDTTENVFIEGDNLEVLKLLQKSYLGKIKMIYIDPPYNTGNDFIYPDNYSETLDTYLSYTGQVDSEGRKFSSNTDTDGRYHSKWMNMIYPRLFLAKNLLKEDGVIFISIDDAELTNLKAICNEIFGEENFEGHIHWRRRHNQPNDKTKMIGTVAEHILCYSKNKEYLKKVGVGKIDLTGSFSNPDNDERGSWASKPWKVGSGQSGSRYKITSPTGVVFDEDWMGEEGTFKALLEDKRIMFTDKGNGLPRKKYYQSEREEEGQCATNWWSHEQFGHNQGGSDDLFKLFGEKSIFDNPKPKELIRGLIQISNAKNNDYVLDFFAGSSTTAQAVVDYNLEFNENLKFICIQLPEILDSTIKEQKSGYDFCIKNNLTPTIASLSKERIRRVINLINENKNKDIFNSDETQILIGFKVFKLSHSNFKIWNNLIEKNAEILQTALELHIEHINKESSQESILFELLLKSGFSLNTQIEKLNIDNKLIYSVADGELLICLEEELTNKVLKGIAERQPSRVICLDKAFDGENADSLKTNAVQIMKSKGVINFRTV
jgi:adenine-specific DNA-methyltransferase